MAKTLSDLKGELRGSKPKARRKARPKTRSGPMIGPLGGTSTIQSYSNAGVLMRKTAYFSPAEWEAILAAKRETGEPASEIIRRAVRNELDL